MKKEIKTKKVPQAAMRFDATEVQVKFNEEDSPMLSMVGYSGGIIKNHMFWGNLAFDLQGIKFDKEKYPILIDHDTDKKVGYMGKPIISQDRGLVIDPNSVRFLNNEHAKQFISDSKAGFPFQSSVYMTPTKLEDVNDGGTAEVNGMELKGEGTVWRESIFKEVSICVFGADSNTHANAFKDDAESIDVECFKYINDDKIIKEEVKMAVTLEQLLSEQPDLVKSIQETAVSAVQEKFVKEKEDLAKENESLKDANNKFSDRLADLEKRDAIRQEQDIKTNAEYQFALKLDNSDIPERLHDKVRNQVNYNKFVKDGTLDTEAFVAAVDVEIQDWVSRGVTSSVIGRGTSTKSVDQSTKMNAIASENEAILNQMLAQAGQKV